MRAKITFNGLNVQEVNQPTDVTVTFNNIEVKEQNLKTLVKILMLKGEKGDTGASGDYNDLLNKPTKLSDFLNDGVFITNAANDLTNYYLKTETDAFLNSKANTADIPTATSELTNDSGFITSADVPTATSELTNDSGFITNAVNDLTNYYQKDETDTLLNAKADTADIPTVTSDLTNDSGFITSADVPTATSELTNDSGFITNAVNNLTNYYQKTETDTLLNSKANTADLAEVATSGSYNDLSNTPTDLTDFSGTLPIAQGGTGATTTTNARSNLGIPATVLYSNTSGTTGTITLSQAYTNFSRIGVYAQGQYNNDSVYNEIYTTINYMTLTCIQFNDANYNMLVWRLAYITFSGNTISFITDGAASFSTGAGQQLYAGNSDGLKIIRVVGYNY